MKNHWIWSMCPNLNWSCRYRPQIWWLTKHLSATHIAHVRGIYFGAVGRSLPLLEVVASCVQGLIQLPETGLQLARLTCTHVRTRLARWSTSTAAARVFYCCMLCACSRMLVMMLTLWRHALIQTNKPKRQRWITAVEPYQGYEMCINTWVSCRMNGKKKRNCVKLKRNGWN